MTEQKSVIRKKRHPKNISVKKWQNNLNNKIQRVRKKKTPQKGLPKEWISKKPFSFVKSLLSLARFRFQRKSMAGLSTRLSVGTDQEYLKDFQKEKKSLKAASTKKLLNVPDKTSREKNASENCLLQNTLFHSDASPLLWFSFWKKMAFFSLFLLGGAILFIYFYKPTFSILSYWGNKDKNESIYFKTQGEAYTPRMGAYIRFKDEIKTLPAMLASIDGVFDKIVMIHSNEPDDGSIAYANWWCAQRPVCEIHMYPYAVVPSNDPRYRKKEVAPENTLAAYYMFGLQFFEPEEYVVKIDADQVYLTKALKKALNNVRRQDSQNKKISYGIKGYNTFVYHNQIVSYRPHPFNGGQDSFIIKRKHIQGFIQKEFWELISLIPGLTYQEIPGYYWFHFMKSLKTQGTIRTLEESQETERLPLTPEQELLFNQEIRPLLRQTASPYHSVSF